MIKFEIGKLYTFPKSYSFLFEKLEHVDRHVRITSRKEESVIKDFTSINHFTNEFKNDLWDNPDRCLFFKLDDEAHYLLPYKPFILLDYHYRSHFGNVCLLKILIEEKIFWTPIYECLFKYDIIVEYTRDMIDKTPEDSLKLF